MLAPPAPAGPSVEFRSGVPARKVEEDDTKEIVSKKAARYLANATRLTVSRLVLIKDGVENSFPLIKDSYTLGRHRNNDIVITDPKASSFHARIDRSQDGFVIVDLQSRNGCWLNGKRVETALLKTGDDVRLGMARLIYRVDYTSAV
jgi:pSer/pThr/pTyr-binding forkhead associated (FHA) protein